MTKKNIRTEEKAIKRRRKLAAFLCFLFFFIISFTAFFLITWHVGSNKTLRYVNSLETLSSDKENFTVKKAENYIEIDCKEDLKILQLSDIHICSGIFRFSLDKKVITEVINRVKETKPDLLVITGDALSPIWITSGTRDSYKQLKVFLALLEKINLPFAFCFGNHDGDGTASEEFISKSLEKAKKSLYLSGEKEVKGEGNYYIKVKFDGEIKSSMIFLNSGGKKKNKYEGVSYEQVLWYEKTVKTLKKENENVKNLLFLHVPVPEYDEFYKKAKGGDGNYVIQEGIKDEKVCFGEQNGLYEKMKELNYTKFVFCGHDHKNNYVVKDLSSGISLCYGMSMDFSAYPSLKFKTKYRGGRIIEIKKSGEVLTYSSPA